MAADGEMLKIIQKLDNKSNSVEETIALQLIGVATFVTTVIGAYIVLPVAQPLGLAGKIFLLIDIILLFFSISCGVIHLLLSLRLFIKARERAALARTTIEKVNNETEKTAVANTIMSETSTRMIFFYLQLIFLGLAVAIFLGLIITLLF